MCVSRGILAILTSEEVRFVYAGVSSGEDRDAAMALLSSVDASHSNARDSVAEWSHSYVFTTITNHYHHHHHNTADVASTALTWFVLRSLSRSSG